MSCSCSLVLLFAFHHYLGIWLCQLNMTLHCVLQHQDAIIYSYSYYLLLR